MTPQTHISSPLRAADALAALVNASGIITSSACVVSLAPRVCEADDGEIQPALFAIPTSLSTDRATRTSVGRDMSVALVLISPVADENAAKTLLADLQAVADDVIAEGVSSGVAFKSYAANELFDAELLVEQSILRAQIDFACFMLEGLP